MGKWTDKLYITHGEWMSQYGGAKANQSRGTGSFPSTVGESAISILPHDYCALTLAPFTTPVAAPSGQVFDLPHIVPYLEQHGQNPVTGQPLVVADLIPLLYSQTSSGEFYCPVTMKNFSNHSHIMAVRTDGRVYSMEGLTQLGEDGIHFKDFFTNKPFTKADIITLQDPQRSQERNISSFEHVRTRAVEASITPKIDTPIKTPSITTVTQTSTIAMDPNVNLKPVKDAESIMFQSIKGTASAMIRTNFGDLNVELFCGKAPRTCFNFLQLAKRGYYAKVKFHRLIPGFVLQGGDPSGTGGGGESCWGPNKPFDNEFYPSLRHNRRGLLSMANRGRRRTNTSQFFITLAPAPHLDGLHPIFGQIVGTDEPLTRIEMIPVDEQHRPLEPIIIQDIIVLNDPFEEYQQRQEQAKTRQRRQEVDPTLLVKRARTTSNTVSTIGRYLPKGINSNNNNKNKS